MDGGSLYIPASAFLCSCKESCGPGSGSSSSSLGRGKYSNCLDTSQRIVAGKSVKPGSSLVGESGSRRKKDREDMAQ